MANHEIEPDPTTDTTPAVPAAGPAPAEAAPVDIVEWRYPDGPSKNDKNEMDVYT